MARGFLLPLRRTPPPNWSCPCTYAPAPTLLRSYTYAPAPVHLRSCTYAATPLRSYSPTPCVFLLQISHQRPGPLSVPCHSHIARPIDALKSWRFRFRMTISGGRGGRVRITRSPLLHRTAPPSMLLGIRNKIVEFHIFIYFAYIHQRAVTI